MTALQATGAFISLEESQPSSAELSIVAKRASHSLMYVANPNLDMKIGWGGLSLNSGCIFGWIKKGDVRVQQRYTHQLLSLATNCSKLRSLN
jgi:hypothetical protein